LNIERFQLGFDMFDRYRQAVAAVTPKDIQVVAGRYLDPGHMILVAAGPIDANGHAIARKAGAGAHLLVYPWEKGGIQYEWPFAVRTTPLTLPTPPRSGGRGSRVRYAWKEWSRRLNAWRQRQRGGERETIGKGTTKHSDLSYTGVIGAHVIRFNDAVPMEKESD